MKNWKLSNHSDAAAKAVNTAAAAATTVPPVTAGSLRRALALVLTAILLVTMLPLAGLAAGQMSNATDLAGSGHPDQAPAFLSAFTAHAASNPTSGSCGDNVKWKYSTSSKTLTISGSGAMWDWQDPLDETAEEFAPWLYYYYDEIKTVNIQSGITEIGTYCFAECEALTSVSIPSSVTAIWDGAFQECISLKSITIPNSVKTIADYAFAFCDSLSTVTVPVSVTELSILAFFYSDGNRSINVASGNTKFKSVDGVVFSKDGKELVIYPTGKTNHVYNVPAGTTTIGEGAFLYNANLRAVAVPEGVTMIGYNAFLFSEKLMRISLPASLKTVQQTAFDACNALTDVFYAGTASQKASISIQAENDPLRNAEWHYNTSSTDMLTRFFEDVEKGSWYAEAVDWAARNGITTGTSDITFSPTKPCDRAQMVTFLWRAANSPEPKSKTHPFEDVAPGSYYEKAVIWALENSITNGMDPTHFGSTSPVTRGQTVTFLYRWKNSPAIDEGEANPFLDVNSADFFYYPVLWAVKNNVTNGISANTFAPGETCTRAQIVTFLYRAK